MTKRHFLTVHFTILVLTFHGKCPVYVWVFQTIAVDGCLRSAFDWEAIEYFLGETVELKIEI
jgi:hypothetical protein